MSLLLINWLCQQNYFLICFWPSRRKLDHFGNNDELNDTVNKSCIIPISLLDGDVEDFNTGFIDMPVANISTPRNPFDALKMQCVINKGTNLRYVCHSCQAPPHSEGIKIWGGKPG